MENTSMDHEFSTRWSRDSPDTGIKGKLTKREGGQRGAKRKIARRFPEFEVCFIIKIDKYNFDKYKCYNGLEMLVQTDNIMN